MYIHVVARGETVYSIAREYGVSWQRILSDNDIANPERLVVGQALLIVVPSEVYTVRRGDSISSVTASSGLTLWELMQYNPELIFNRTLQPGQQLVLSFFREKRGARRVLGYAYPHINRATLQRSLPYLSYLALFSYGFKEDGSLISIDDAELIRLSYDYGVGPVMVLSTIGEDGGFSTEKARSLLQSAELQETVLNNIIAAMQSKGYVGLDVDFEYIDADLKEEFVGFLGTAAGKLHQHGLFLNVALAPKTSSTQSGLLYEAHDYKAIGSIADSVLLMTYEWGYTYGPPMAVSPAPQVRQVVRYAVSEISPNKIYLGIPNYGYDWALPYEKGVTKASNIGNQYAVELAARYGAVIRFDESARAPYFEYRRDNVSHVVWFEDVRSIETKYAITDEFSLMGAGYWTVMRPFSANWIYLAANYDIEKIDADTNSGNSLKSVL